MKKMKTGLITLLCLLFSIDASAFKVNGIEYDFNADGKSVKVIPWDGKKLYFGEEGYYSGDFVIPAEIVYNGQTYPVTEIGKEAFELCTSLTSIEIPNSVTSIGNCAFNLCWYIGTVKIPNSVTSIGDYAFAQCPTLTSVEIPNSVTSIGVGAFFTCSSLTSVEIPNSVTSIGAEAFSDCTSLTSVSLGDSVTSIGSNAFNDCTSLTSIKVDAENKVYDSRKDCNAIIETESNTLILGSSQTVIPNSVTSIGKSAFLKCTSLTSIEIPNSVTSIGAEAFSDCTSLTSVSLGDSVTSIEKSAFFKCTSLTSIEIPNSVTKIGERAFAYCSSLTSLEILNSVTSIGADAFIDCYSLTSVSLGDSVTSIGDRAFSSCWSMGTVKIPNSVTKIGISAFYNCSGMGSIDIPNSVTSIGAKAFSDCYSLTSIIIPNSVTSIGQKAFYNCYNLNSLTVQNLNSAINDSHCLDAPTKGFETFAFEVSNPEVLTVDNNGRMTFLTPGIADITVTGKDKNGQPMTRVCKVTVGGARATVSKAGYATFSTLSDYQVPEELQAGIVEVSGKNAVVSYLEPTSSCYPSDEAVILKGAPGEYFLPTPMDKTVLEKNANNDLKAAHTNRQINAEAGNELFVLANGNNGLGFYYQMGCPDGSYVKDMMGKGYLDLPSTTLMGLNSLRLFDASVTGIEEVETENGSNAAVVYTLSGVRMNQPVDQLPKGVYIVNGKKVMVK